MNIVAKIRRIAADVEEIKARLDAMEGPNDPRPGAVPMEAGKYGREDLAELIYEETAKLPPPPFILLDKTINELLPIASATLAPTPRKRGRPPKPKS